MALWDLLDPQALRENTVREVTLDSLARKASLETLAPLDYMDPKVND